jgi:hypothetical protein
VLVPWTPLTPSRRERAVRRAGVFLAVATSVTLAVAAARADAFDAFLTAAAALALLAGAVAGRPRPPAPLEVGVDRSGALAVRRADDAESVPEHGLQCVFAAPWLITLRRGTIWIPIWPDSVPGNSYRRLWVHIRWRSGRPPADLPAGIAPDQTE